MKNKNQNSLQKSEERIPSWNFTRCFIIIILALFFSVNANAQIPAWEWAKGIGGTGDDRGSSVTVDASGNVYTTGKFSGTVDFDPGVGVFNLTSAGSYDIFISKLDNDGNFVWAKRMGGPGDDGTDWVSGRCIVVDASGNIYTTGYFSSTADFDPGSSTYNLTSSGSIDIYVAKFDNQGNFIWAKGMGGTSSEMALSIALDVNNNVYTTGRFAGTSDFDPGPGVYNLTESGMGSYHNDIFISKLDNAGNFVWAKQISGFSIEDGFDLAYDASGNICITGAFYGTVDFDPNAGVFNMTAWGGGFGIFILKINTSGNFVWAKSFAGNSGGGIGYGVSVDKLGNIYLVGGFHDSLDFDPGIGVFNLTSKGSWDIIVVKLTASGNLVWAKNMGAGGSGHDEGFSIAVDSLGNVYTCGIFEGVVDFDPGVGVFNLTAATGYDIFVSKLDYSGNFVWANSIKNGSPSFLGCGITVDANESAYLVSPYSASSITFGSTIVTNNGPSDIFIAKLSNIRPPCSNTNCTISPRVKSTNVSNTGCNNGTIKVNRGNGAYLAFPHIELYDVSNNLISTVNLAPGISDYAFTNLSPGHYTVNVSDDSCCLVTFYRNIKCRAPYSGFSATNVTATNAQLNWNVVNCASGYRVQYRPQGTTTWTTRGVNTNVGFKNIAGLQPNTTYQWKVATKCVGWPTVDYLGYSAISTFTTAALRIGEEQSVLSTETFDISLYPNPATYTVTVNFEADASTATMSLMNTVGQVMFEKQLNGADGIYEEQLDVSKLNTGIYMLQVKTDQGMSWKKFIKE